MRKKKRVGRGGKRGKTSGRGHKGQKARAGHKIRPEMRDIIKKLPKRRGYGKNRGRTVNPRNVKPKVVNLTDINKAFGAGETVSPRTLLEKNLIRRERGRTPTVKILGTGELAGKYVFERCLFSDSARSKVEKSGSTIQ